MLNFYINRAGAEPFLFDSTSISTNYPIAIVSSLVYLGVQIPANMKVLRSQAPYNALSVAQRPAAVRNANQGLESHRADSNPYGAG
jgi:hypothetical protein